MPRKLATHRQLVRQQRPELRRRVSSWSRGYDSSWMKLRDWFLARHPLCAHCLEHGITEAAVDVDHIEPIRWGGARLDAENLQSLCKQCHARKTARERGDCR